MLRQPLRLLSDATWLPALLSVKEVKTTNLDGSCLPNCGEHYTGMPYEDKRRMVH